MEDPNVVGVKNGHPSNYPNQTYGDAFSNFFAAPTWKYFKGEKEGPDDDGDGKPDYTESDIDVVEFTGRCTYSDTEVKALLQFTLDKDSDTFQATYLSFNDVPQSTLMMMNLLDTVFSNNETTETTEATESVENPDNIAVEGTDSGDVASEPISADTETDDYIFSESSDVELTEADLAGLTAQELTYARNEIYARHGYVFKSEELNEYFMGKRWYVPDETFDGTLTGLEEVNATFISNYQDENGLTYKPQ